MTKARTYRETLGRDGRAHFFIDGQSVSEARFRDSQARSERSTEEPRIVPLLIIETKERVRGSREGITMRYLVNETDADAWAAARYDQGENYVARYSARRVTQGAGRFSSEVFEEGEVLEEDEVPGGEWDADSSP